MIRYSFYISLVFVFLSYFGIAQDEEETTKPLELPNFIIEGKEQLNVQAGIKQMPDSPPPLSSGELDSLSKLQKQKSLLLPPLSFPENIFEKSEKIGYIRAGFDSYITPKLDAGLNLEISDHASVFGNARYEYSQGHVENSEYTKTNIDLMSDYIAPEKYWIFGGSKTQTYAKFLQSKYLPYSAADPVERSVSGFDIGIHSEGKHEGYKFITGAELKSMDLTDETQNDPQETDESSLSGYLELTGMFKGFEIGGDFLVDFRSIKNETTNYFKGAGLAKYYSEKMTVEVLSGIEHALTNTDIRRTALLLDASIICRLDHIFTIKGSFRSGFDQTSLHGLHRMNPYISDNIIIDYDYKRQVRGIFTIHPDTDLQASLNMLVGTGSRTPYFVDDDQYFAIEYEKTQQMKVEAELDWNLTILDNLTFLIGYDHHVLKRNQNYLPYHPQIVASANYRREWLKGFGTKIGLYYIGDRYTDSENDNLLDGYLDLGINANYKISESLSFFVNLNNITNSDIYVWKGYKERDVYLSGGILWQF